MPYWRRLFSTGYINPKDGLPDVTPSQSSEIVSLLSAGTFFGALSAAPTADMIGRRFGLMASTVVFTFGVILQTVATAIPLFVAGRFFAGFGVGMISAMSESNVSLPFCQSSLLIGNSSPLPVRVCSKVDSRERCRCISVGYHDWPSPRIHCGQL